MGIPTIKSYPMPKENELPKNKVSWDIDPNRAVLLIHDMQKYFLKTFESEQSPVVQLIQNIQLIKDECVKNGVPVVYTAQPGNQDPGDRALLQDFWGPGLRDISEHTAVVDKLEPTEQDLVLTKWRYSAFQRTDLQEIMHKQGRDQLIICGVYTHIGCLLTASEAFMRDIQTFFVADAVADFSYEDHIMALKYVASRCGFVTTTNHLLEKFKSEPQIITLDQLKEQVAELLDEPPNALSESENLIDRGLDSIRMMSLIEEWRQIGIQVDFMSMTENPTLLHWMNLLSYSKT
ncbi:isochorismatase [Hazenella sp. IB182357]|uniref:isochorismatase n=1 Tax=Polycladospora coralii TaxID=2771432 RepID=A0A926N5L9_9BACL|nr:isochorismatase [Polycladospora coralii]MBD1371006.1 isochorismatase [Polycladospora coralii]MBS7529945.1 isochorismatase [Polycladospora coralii]